MAIEPAPRQLQVGLRSSRPTVLLLFWLLCNKAFLVSLSQN